jgi:hypothetical protein
MDLVRLSFAMGMTKKLFASKEIQTLDLMGIIHVPY